MSTAHGQTVLIGERGQIMRMRRVHHKSYERPALFGWPKDTRPRQFPEALSCISRQLQVVFKNRCPTDLLDVIDRGCEANGVSDTRRTSFESMRRLLEHAPLEGDAHDHFAAPVPRRHGIENLSAPIEDTDPSRSTHLMSREREEITAQLAHID